MKRFILVPGLAFAPMLATPAFGQAVTATLPVTCPPSGVNCVQSTPVVNPDGTNVGSSGGGPSSSQLPATLGAKTGALSLSVVPNTDTAFPINDSGSADAAVNSTTVSSAAAGWSGSTAGYGALTFQLIANASGNTIVIEGSNDGGTTWSSVGFRALAASGANPTLTSTSITGNPSYTPAGIMPLMRWRVSSFIGGTTTVAVGFKRTSAPNSMDVNVPGTVAVSSTTLATAANQATMITNQTATGTSAQNVQGAQANAAATTVNPMLIAGYDATNTRAILTDTSGRVFVISSANSPVVISGTIANDGVDSGNPIKIGGFANNAGQCTAVSAAADRVNACYTLTGVAYVEESGRSYCHIATATTTTCKSGAGSLHTVTINNLGTVASMTTIYDNTAGSGTVIAVINTLAGQESYIYDLGFATGLTFVTTGTVAPDITATYR